MYSSLMELVRSNCSLLFSLSAPEIHKQLLHLPLDAHNNIILCLDYFRVKWHTHVNGTQIFACYCDRVRLPVSSVVENFRGAILAT